MALSTLEYSALKTAENTPLEPGRMPAEILEASRKLLAQGYLKANTSFPNASTYTITEEGKAALRQAELGQQTQQRY